MTIDLLTPSDTSKFTTLIRLFEEVFEMQGFTFPGDDYLKKLLQQDNFLVFIAMHENEVVGGLTAHILPSYYSESSEGYIYDIVVKPAFQRQGIGKKLITAFTGHCRSKGYSAIFVQADEADAHALDFYRSIGATPQNVVHFNFRIEK